MIYLDDPKENPTYNSLTEFINYKTKNKLNKQDLTKLVFVKNQLKKCKSIKEAKTIIINELSTGSDIEKMNFLSLKEKREIKRPYQTITESNAYRHSLKQAKSEVNRLNLNTRSIYQLNEYKDAGALSKSIGGRKLFKELTPTDVSLAKLEIKKIYQQNSEMQKNYPDLIERLDKAFNKFIKIYNEKPQRLKDIIARTEKMKKNYLNAYTRYVRHEIKDTLLNILKDKKDVKQEQDYIEKELAKVMNIKVSEVKEILTLKDKNIQRLMRRYLKSKESVDVADVINLVRQEHDDNSKNFMNQNFKLAYVYEAIKEVYNKFLAKIKRTLENSANQDVKIIERPGKFKKAGKALAKFLFGKFVQKRYDTFLDLKDITGYRAMCDNLDSYLDFLIKVSELKQFKIFKLKKAIGEPSPYQGTNFGLSFEGSVYTELQVVLDYSQVAADIGHDIFYKTIVQVDPKQEEKIVAIIQMALALTFYEMEKK